MRQFAVAATRYVAGVAVFVGALDLVIGSRWVYPVAAFGAAAWFAGLSWWIKRSGRSSRGGGDS